MKSPLRYAWEILFDAFFEFRSPTAKCLECQEDVARSKDEIIQKEDGDSVGNIDRYLELAFGRLDKEEESRSYSIQKSYQLLAFNMALNVFIASTVLDDLSNISGWTLHAASILLFFLLYTGTKSALHCLVAIANRNSYCIPPKFFSQYSAIREKKKTHETNGSELLRDIEWIYEKNEDQRAIIAEHTGISLHTSIVQVVLVGILLTHLYLTPWIQGILT